MARSKPNTRREDPGSHGLAQRAVALYQPRTSRQLVIEDGHEIVHNLAGFLSVLADWKKRELAARAAGGAK